LKDQPKEETRADLFADPGAGHTQRPGDELFAEFWAAYPKRVARGAAVKAWSAAIKAGADPDDVIAAARRYRSERDLVADPVERARFTANAATWLRAERWADEAAPAAADTGGGILIDGITGDPIPEPPPRQSTRPPRNSALGDFALAYAAARNPKG
jgi:hypothetical protein